MNHLAADLWISTRCSSLFSDVTNRSGISALNTALQMKTAVLTSMENYFLFQFAFARLGLRFKPYSCPLFLSWHVMCFLFLSTEASFGLNFALSWTISTAMLAAGHSDLAVTLFGVLLSWCWSCLSCLGNMRWGSWEPHKCHVSTEPLGRAGSPCQKRR